MTTFGREVDSGRSMDNPSVLPAPWITLVWNDDGGLADYLDRSGDQQ